MKEKQTPSKERSKVVTLVRHILTTPTLSADLQRLHDIALYDSNCPIEAEDKAALLNCVELGRRIKSLNKKDKAFLYTLIE
jgi:hypothetical protein